MRQELRRSPADDQQLLFWAGKEIRVQSSVAHAHFSPLKLDRIGLGRLPAVEGRGVVAAPRPFSLAPTPFASRGPSFA